ncbi:nucleoside triphosphate pyrophosphohydrolase [Velocimicrobium porci]|uniref:Nucleoside triphosphate pyrophosphohydrolase n=1 Tax=Velocimicrobium porci TaxID=2606634 RepID=A0A6L5XZN1_9FIRM|nr:nucleoside triphosphate pyrophosphohydrolase [Velocimicrobium porci]MSS63931.1 nucleoside triphosphate pyrophosphohydrolase [Velocimicrobium porci]
MKEFDEFVKIIRILRSENGCPWDREQTHESLRQCMLEEAYEVVDAVDKKDIDNLREELGDVLLQVVMNGVIAEEKKEFTMEEMIQEVSEKMVHRHPHVFGTTEVKNSDEVLKNWEELKQKEKKETSVSDSIKRIPLALPANIRAAKVQKKAAKVGFDFDNYEEVLSKVYEELSELEDAKRTGDICKIEEEFGDLLFSVVNLSRFLQINAENSLTNATNKFINRFVGVESLARLENRQLSELSIDEMNDLWNRVKESE